ncbi:phage tail assembly chaperone [Kaistia soli]|nr:hypothetical protein [Kaistia soli]
MQSRPALARHLLFEWTAFRRLALDRPRGFGIAPIPWSSIDRYANRFGIADPDRFERFSRLMMAMDAAVLRIATEKDVAP